MNGEFTERRNQTERKDINPDALRQLLAAIERDLQKKREPVAAGSRKDEKTIHETF